MWDMTDWQNGTAWREAQSASSGCNIVRADFPTSDRQAPTGSDGPEIRDQIYNITISVDGETSAALKILAQREDRMVWQQVVRIIRNELLRLGLLTEPENK